MIGVKLAQKYIENLPAEHLAKTLFKTPEVVKDPESPESQAALSAAAAKRARKAAKRRA